MTDSTDRPWSRHPFKLGGFTVDPVARTLTSEHGTVQLEPKVMDVLVVLAGNAGRVVPREEILQRVWPRAASDEVLSRAIYQLRKHFGEDSRAARYIATVPKRGYSLAVQPRPHDAAQSGPARADRGLPLRPALAVAAAVVAAVALFFLRDDPMDRGAESPHRGPARVVMMPIAADQARGRMAILALALNDRLRSAIAEHDRSGDVSLQWHPQQDGTDVTPSPDGPHYAFHGKLAENPGEDRALLHLYIDSISGAEVVTSPLNVFEVPYIGSDSHVGRVAEYREAIIQRILYYLTVELPHVHRNFDELEIEAFRLLLYADWELYSGKDCGIGAHSLLQRATELNPDSARAWAQLGEAYWAQIWDCGRGRDYLDDALHALGRSLAVDPDHVAAHYLRAIIRAETGDVEKAYADLQRLVDRAPDDTYLLYARMEVLIYAGFLREATVLLERAVAADSLALSAEMVDMPKSLLHAGQYDPFIELAPTKPIAFMHYSRALAHTLRGDRARAQELLGHQRALGSGSVFVDYGTALRACLDGDRDAVVAVIRNIESRRAGATPVDGRTAFREAQLLALAGADDMAAQRVQQAIAGGFFCPSCYRPAAGFQRLAGRPDFERALQGARQRHLAFARRFDLVPETGPPEDSPRAATARQGLRKPAVNR